MPVSPALQDYLSAFQGPHAEEPFLTFYPAGSPISTPTTWTRGALWALAQRFAHVLKHQANLNKGDCQVHLFAANSVEDVALRLASVMVGTVPVTVNWDSDTLDRVVFKVQSSQAKVVLTHAKTPAEQIAAVQQLPGVVIMAVENMLHSPGEGEAGGGGAGTAGTTPKTDPETSTGPPLLLHVLDDADFDPSVTLDDTRIIIYTSGSSGDPKGVLLSYHNYVKNRATFESFLLLLDPSSCFTPLLANPLHHTNSTAFSDWALRRPGTHLHLYERYSSSYWTTIVRLALGLPPSLPLPSDPNSIHALLTAQTKRKVRLILPTVSRHFDFLETLFQDPQKLLALNLPSPEIFKLITSFSYPPPSPPSPPSSSSSSPPPSPPPPPLITFLLGSAPVGPGTVNRLIKFVGQLPVVRFGSTETCLQVCGTPMTMAEDKRLDAFRRGWALNGNDGASGEEGGLGGGGEPGYYIGRPHPPYTEMLVVEGVDPSHPSSYLKECSEGKQGFVVTRGNLMKGYVQGEKATRSAIHTEAGGWYTSLGDVGFWLFGEVEGEREGEREGGGERQVKDFYWVTRTSNLLIRGGTNYSYEQISQELTRFVKETYDLSPEKFVLAAVGLRVSSEHEDDCLVTIEVKGEGGKDGEREEVEKMVQGLEATFVQEAKKSVSKGAKPSRVRLGEVPRNFKGDVNWRALEVTWKEILTQQETKE